MRHVRKIIGITAAALLLSAGAVRCLTPTFARVVNTASYTIQLPQKQPEETVIESNLLTQDGQEILLSKYKESYEFLITITAISGTMPEAEPTVSFPDGSYVLWPLGNTGTEQIYKLTLIPRQPAQETTDMPDETAQDSLEETENQLAEEANAPQAEEPALGTATVQWQAEEISLSATFTVPLSAQTTSESTAGNLVNCPSQYCKEIPLALTVDNADTTLTLNDGEFPALTRYSSNGTTVILYDGGVIHLSANASVELDLSQTEVEGDIIINGTPLIQTDDPVGEQTDTAYVLQEITLQLPISYRWGNAEPTIQIEQLLADAETAELTWNPVDTITASETEAGKIQLESAEAAAGTYRIVLDWKENEMELYHAEIPFFVQNNSMIAGGAGNET